MLGKKTSLSFILISSLFFSLPTYAEENFTDRFSAGIGYGITYSGLGAKIEMTVIDQVQLYGSVGALSSAIDHGFNVGLLFAPFTEYNKHSIGVNIGHVFNSDAIGTEEKKRGAASLAYNFAENGLNNKGFSVSISTVFYGVKPPSLDLSFGYQWKI